MDHSRARRLKLLPYSGYAWADCSDPVRYYYWPILGAMYRRRVELCLAQLRGGERILEVGFGSGVTFLNLREQYREIHGIDLTASVETVKAAFDALGIPTHLRNGDMLDMPYPDDWFDAVLLISILEHLKPEQMITALRGIRRVLKPGGQMVYGVPVERRLMALAFRLLGYNIRKHHFSTERQVWAAAISVFGQGSLVQMAGVFGPVYQVGHFVKL